MEDLQIIELFFQRSEEAVSQTDRKYGRFLRSVAGRILSIPEDSEEVVNDTYLVAWNKIPPEVPKVLKYYLSRIARNLALSRFDYGNAQKRSAFAEVAISELEECIPDPAAQPEMRAEQRELTKTLNRFLSGLSRLDCALFVGRYFYNRTAAELGRKYDMREYQVKYRLKKHSGKLRFFLIAAALVSLLGVTAYAVTAKIQLNTKRYMQGTGESVDADASVPYEAEINFQSTADTYDGLQTYCPSWLPEGYRLRFVSAKAYGRQTLHFATASDESALVLETTRGDNATDLVIESVAKEESITVGSLPGTLYTCTGGERVLLWTDEDRGVGFMLLTGDTELNLVRVAESVRPDPDLKPTNEDRYQLALEELGDYQITGLPENYPETEFIASPKEDGGGWFAYVYRWYIDAKKNSTVELEYETFLLNGDKDGDSAQDSEPVPETPDTILKMNGGGEAATVQGMPAAVTQGHIVWVDWENKMVFQITADSMDADQLQQLADSVQKVR